jgi:hypothetical protein
VSARQQAFNGPVQGDVAGRDVVKQSVTVEQLAVHVYAGPPPASPPPSESQLQADFVRNTGIKESNPAARAHLDWLMVEHGFNLPDLRRAWSAGSLRWSESARQWKAQHRRLDLIWGWCSIALLATLLVVSLVLVALRVQDGHWAAAASLLSVAFYGTVAYFVTITSIVPQRVAARVAQAYARGGTPRPVATDRHNTEEKND